MQILMSYIFVIIFGSLALAQSAENDPYSGDWVGQIDVGQVQLNVILRISAESVEFISVDQGNATLPVDMTRRDATGISGNMPSAAASFALDLIDPDTLEGRFIQVGREMPMRLVRQDAGSAPQQGFTPVNGTDQEVEIDANGVRLGGALLIPSAQTDRSQYPALLLLNGSGAQDRNATIEGQPVFGALADALAERGIASLRLDDRGVGRSVPVVPSSPHDIARDSAIATSFLREAAGIDSRCVGVLGHSEGALIAFLAAEDAQPDFILSLGGMHTTMAQTLLDQSEAIFLASGAGQAAADQNRVLQTAMFEIMRDETIEDYPAALTAGLVELGLPEEIARQQGAIWGQDYAIASLDLDASPQMAAFDGPVHGLFGENDLQALAGPQSDALLAGRGEQPTQITVIPGVNHLFQSSETGLPQEYANAPHAMAPEALSIIADAAEDLIAQACE